MSITSIGRNILIETKERVSTVFRAVVVYGDTDSLMLQIPAIEHPSKCDYWGRLIEAEISGIPAGGKDPRGEVHSSGRPGWFKNLTMEYEKSMRMLCLTKKKYAYLTIGVDGNFVVDSKQSTDGEIRYKIGNKGVILSRIDNCQFMKTIYEGVLDMVLTRPIGEALDYLMHVIELLIMGYVPNSMLSITKRLGAAYKGNATMKVFADRLQKRGVDVKPGERLPYVIILNGERTVGERMELFDDYREDDPHGFPIDYLYYVNNLLKNPLDQLFSIGFSDQLSLVSLIELRENRRRKPVPLTQPVAFLSWMIEGKVAFSLLEDVLTGRQLAEVRWVTNTEILESW